ncbi:MAG TPA: SurA N-terminal domain-containing protein [Polyangiaceae bacterium]
MILATLALSFGLAALDQAPYVDRVAAVVGDHIVLLSEVRARATLVARTQRSTLAQMTDAILHEVTERLVEEYLEESEADRLKITVGSDEVDHAVEQLAQGNNTSVQTLMKTVESQGVKPDELREALRRQLLEGKLLLLRSNQMQRIDEKDLRARYEQMKKQVKDPKDLKSYDELKNELLNELLQERIAALREDWMAQLRARTYVDIRVGGGSQ